MANQNTKTTTTTTTTTTHTPTEIQQINNNTNKTLQPTQHDVHTSIGLGSGGIAMGIISLLSVVFGVIYKLLSNKKLRQNILKTIDEIEKDYLNLKNEFKDKKHDIQANATLLEDTKQKQIEALTKEYQTKLSSLEHRKSILQDKLGGK